jgi:hypothetical protein
MPSDKFFSTIGGIAGLVGAPLLLITSLLHPMSAHPADAPAAFAEYAQDRYWVATHLGQFFGTLLLGGALLALSWRLRDGRSGAWAVLGAIGITITLAVFGALQAVDGIALKMAVDRWAGASPIMQPLLFEAAFAVRVIEIGLASVASLALGLTAVLYAAALLASTRAPKALGWLGIGGGGAVIVSGSLLAYTGFSDAAMLFNLAGFVLLLIWIALIAGWLLRSARLLYETP